MQNPMFSLRKKNTHYITNGTYIIIEVLVSSSAYCGLLFF